MGTWADISVECEVAAKQLLRSGCYRSSTSRAYYAVYSAITDRLVAAGVVPETDADNPSHKSLPEMIESNVPGLRSWQRRDLKTSTRRLYQLRIDADYRARALVAIAEATESLAEMGFSLRLVREVRAT